MKLSELFSRIFNVDLNQDFTLDSPSSGDTAADPDGGGESSVAHTAVEKEGSVAATSPETIPPAEPQQNTMTRGEPPKVESPEERKKPDVFPAETFVSPESDFIKELNKLF